MTAIPDIQLFQAGTATEGEASHARPYDIETAYWGYVIRGNRRASAALIAVQVSSLVAGAFLALASIGIWTMASAEAAQGLFLFKIGASVPAAAAAMLLLWFGSRGTRIDIEVDTNQGELREVLRNRAGRSTVIGVCGFDAIGGVFLQRDGHEQAGDDQARLVLRYRNSAQVLTVAGGPAPLLEHLRDKLGHDLMVRRRKVAQAADPMSESAEAA